MLSFLDFITRKFGIYILCGLLPHRGMALSLCLFLSQVMRDGRTNIPAWAYLSVWGQQGRGQVRVRRLYEQGLTFTKSVETMWGIWRTGELVLNLCKHLWWHEACLSREWGWFEAVQIAASCLPSPFDCLVPQPGLQSCWFDFLVLLIKSHCWSFVSSFFISRSKEAVSEIT